MPLGQFENVGVFMRDCYGEKLQYDRACLEVITNEEVTFWSQYDECQDCKLLSTKTFNTNVSLVLRTLSPVHYSVTKFKDGKGPICNGTCVLRILLRLLCIISLFRLHFRLFFRYALLNLARF